MRSERPVRWQVCQPEQSSASLWWCSLPRLRSHLELSSSRGGVRLRQPTRGCSRICEVWRTLYSEGVVHPPPAARVSRWAVRLVPSTQATYL